MNETLITRAEAAKYLRVKPRTISEYVKGKKLNPSKVGCRLLFKQADIDQLVKDSSINQKSHN